MAADDNGLIRSVQDAIAFLRMAAVEMRRLAADCEGERPGDALQLRHMAQQCDADAAELTRQVENSQTG